jgi:hypothetical protein
VDDFLFHGSFLPSGDRFVETFPIIGPEVFRKCFWYSPKEAQRQKLGGKVPRFGKRVLSMLARGIHFEYLVTKSRVAVYEG